MCLDIVYRGKQKREALAKLPDEFPVWKYLIRLDNGTFRTACSRDVVLAGEQRAPYRGPAKDIPINGDPLVGSRAYRSGWHAWVEAPPCHSEEIGCRAKKKHVRAIGTQGQHVVVVLSHITFPKKCGVPK